jgi:thiosulfate/3-mercaptopyruvate sulfurtransferase
MFTSLISVEQLAQNIQNPDWVILDCRHDLMNPQAGRDAFNAGHLPHAQFADIDIALSDKSPAPHGKFKGRHPLPSRETFIQTLQEWGITEDSQVVAYDAQGGMFAARLWWMLRWVGHAAVAVLDGGLPAWQAAGQRVTTEVRARSRGTILLKPSLVSTVNADELVANLESGKKQVVDARAPDRFRGENEIIDPVGGHIPNAVNRFFKDNLEADGRFKAPEQLRQELGALIPDVQSAVMQCGSGVTACHNLLALEVAGMSGASLYPGSWSEWCADPKRPVATGS